MEIVNLLTEMGNMLFVMGGMFGLYWAIKWHNHEEASPDTKKMVQALGIIILAIVVRLGYWAVGVDHAPNGIPYHPWFIDHRHWVSMIGATIFTVGILRFVGSIEHFSCAVILRSMFVIVSAAVIFSLL